MIFSANYNKDKNAYCNVLLLFALTIMAIAKIRFLKYATNVI